MSVLRYPVQLPVEIWRDWIFPNWRRGETFVERFSEVSAGVEDVVVGPLSLLALNDGSEDAP